MQLSENYRRKAGFSLIELLGVMAIMAIIGYLTIPAFSSISHAQSVNQGAYELSSLLQLARSEAVSRQTYVWVGFSQTTTAAGLPQLTMVATSSLDGSPDTTISNLANLTRPASIAGLVLTPWSGLKAATQSVFTSTTSGHVAPQSIVGGNSAGMAFPVITAPITNTVTFTPRGEAMLNRVPTLDTPFDPYLDVSIRQPTASNNDAGVVIEGGTGMVQIVRVP